MIKCPVCGREFKNKRGLGSHMRYVHGVPGKHARREGGGEGGSEEEEPLNLREKLINILKDVGVKKGMNTIVDIFFDLGGEDLKKLDRLLRTIGVPLASRRLVLERYGQLIGVESPKGLEEEEGEESELFKMYEILEKRELQDLLIEDLRTRIEERKRRLEKKKEEEEEEREELEEELEGPPRPYPCPCIFPNLNVRALRGPDGLCLYCFVKDRQCLHYSCVEVLRCYYCGCEIDVTGVPLGYEVTCPVCGARGIKNYPGVLKIVRKEDVTLSL